MVAKFKVLCGVAFASVVSIMISWVVMAALASKDNVRALVLPSMAADPVNVRATIHKPILTAFLDTQKVKIDELLPVFLTVCWLESNYNPDAVNEQEGAWGVAQIRPIMIDDCNRIVGRKTWKREDAFGVLESYAMFRTYCLHYYPQGTDEQWIRAWNGGPDGPNKAATLVYYSKGKEELAKWKRLIN